MGDGLLGWGGGEWGLMGDGGMGDGGWISALSRLGVRNSFTQSPKRGLRISF